VEWATVAIRRRADSMSPRKSASRAAASEGAGALDAGTSLRNLGLGAPGRWLSFLFTFLLTV